MTCKRIIKYKPQLWAYTSATVDGPTGGTHREGVASNQGAAQAADVEAQEGFDPSRFWLLLEQAGYKAW